MKHRKLLCHIMTLLFATFIFSPLQFGTSKSGIVAKAACELTTEQIANYFNSRVGETYTSNACLAFIADGFQALGAERSSACCAYNYGLSHLSSTSRDIPIGADVFFTSEGCKYDYIDGNGHHSGHIGVYVGDGYIVHSYSSKIQKMLISTVESHGYTYWGWGIHGGVSIIEYLDTKKPVIANVCVSDMDATGYTVNCTATDDKGISSVKFPTWTINEGQDDIIWGEGTKSGDTYSYRVNIGDHHNETGEYITHIYAYDIAGNECSFGLGAIAPRVDTIEPVISNIVVCDVDENGFTIRCKVTDNIDVSRVMFPTWTLKEDSSGNNQDDIIWGWGSRDGDTFTYRVNKSEHNNELENYLTHIYAYDLANNVVSDSAGVTSIVQDEINPVISDIYVSDRSEKGYTVHCTVSDEGGSGISRVQFPTWTAENDQDDIQDSWWINSTANGTIDENNHVTFRVNIIDHNNEKGKYITHIYVYDKCGNLSCKAVPDILIDEKTAVIKGDCNGDGLVSTSDIVHLQKWILQTPDAALKDFNAAELNGDGIVDVFDLGLLKRKLVSQK